MFQLICTILQVLVKLKKKEKRQGNIEKVCTQNNDSNRRAT